MKLLFLFVFVLYAIVLSAGLGWRGLRGKRRVAAPGGAASGGVVSREAMVRLLIVGATGGTGRQLVGEALARGYVVTALVRDPSRLRVQHENLRVVRGDVRDHASIETAVRGQDAVISALGHKRFFYPTRVLSEGTGNLLRAMETHGVSRLVCITSLGIGDSAGRMGLYYTLFVIPAILPFYFWDKTRQERLIAASGLQWVIVRPGALTNGARRRTYRHGHDVGSLVRTVHISRMDVADFVLNQMTDDTYLRTATGVCW